MRHYITSKIIADKKEVLETLIKNRAEHAQIYEEACAGYLRDAAKALKARLELITSGKMENLSFHEIVMPQSYLKVYDTAILMFKMHTESTIELTSQEFSNFMLDDWDWAENFLISNARYSNFAATKLNQ